MNKQMIPANRPQSAAKKTGPLATAICSACISRQRTTNELDAVVSSEQTRYAQTPFRLLFGRPFVKRFALCYRPLSCLSCLSVCPVLSVTLVHCGQTVGRIKMIVKLGMQVDLGPGHIVLDGDPAPLPPKRHSPQFSAHIYCGQIPAWIKMPLGLSLIHI